MTPPKLGVGPLEMEILGILQGQRDLSVTDIQSRLKKSGHALAYTTVMTVVSRLYDKKLLVRHKDGRQYLYSPAEGSAQKEAPTVSIFQKVRKSLFRGERLKPILALLDADEELTREELRELKKAVDEKLKRMT